MSFGQLLFNGPALLHQHRINERWEGILENGVETGFLPACFWLAWFRYQRRPGRKTARAVRPLLEQAAEAGHPGARLLLARWKMQGKFGLRAVREGWREDGVLLREFPCAGVERRNWHRRLKAARRDFLVHAFMPDGVNQPLEADALP